MTSAVDLTLDIQTTSDLTHWQLVSAFALVGGTNFFVAAVGAETNKLFRARIR
jgi:hypothetical protein